MLFYQNATMFLLVWVRLRLQTIDDVKCRLGKVQVFTDLEAKDGSVPQVKLEEDSNKLTNFHTPFGRYGWLRMLFGIFSAPEEFQGHVNELTEGLGEVTAIVDDMLVTGAGDTYKEALVDHNRNRIALLDGCRKMQRNFKLHKERFFFQATEAEVLWAYFDC